MARLARFISIAALICAALISALLFSAARADFVFRGCPDFPRSDWADTVNCSDDWFGLILFAATFVAVLLVGAFIWRVGRKNDA